MTTKNHIFAIPTHADHTGDAIAVSRAHTIKHAVEAVQCANFVVIAEDDGGCHDHYDADDAPGVYGYEPDGLGAYGITVKA